jgi:hypothetical protein
MQQAGEAVLNAVAERAGAELGPAFANVLRAVAKGQSQGDVARLLETAATGELDRQLARNGVPAEVASEVQRLLKSSDDTERALTLLARTTQQAVVQNLARSDDTATRMAAQAMAPVVGIADRVQTVAASVDPVEAVKTNVLRSTIGSGLVNYLEQAAPPGSDPVSQAVRAIALGGEPLSIAAALPDSSGAQTLPSAATAEMNSLLQQLLPPSSLSTIDIKTFLEGVSAPVAAALAPLADSTTSVRALLASAEDLDHRKLLQPLALPLLRSAITRNGAVAPPALVTALQSMAEAGNIKPNVRASLRVAAQLASGTGQSPSDEDVRISREALGTLRSSINGDMKALAAICDDIFDNKLTEACARAAQQIPSLLVEPKLKAEYEAMRQYGQFDVDAMAASIRDRLTATAAAAHASADHVADWMTALPEYVLTPLLAKAAQMNDAQLLAAATEAATHLSSSAEERRLLVAKIVKHLRQHLVRPNPVPHKQTNTGT